MIKVEFKDVSGDVVHTATNEEPVEKGKETETFRKMLGAAIFTYQVDKGLDNIRNEVNTVVMSVGDAERPFTLDEVAEKAIYPFGEELTF